MQFSKTDFIHYLNCPKSLWLLKHRPDDYPNAGFSDYAKKIAAEGYEVEAYVKALLSTRPDADSYAFQSVFQTDRGPFARADVTQDNGDGTITLFEVKSSTQVKTGGGHSHIKDAAFQMIAAEDTGLQVARVFVVHLNGAYSRAGAIDAKQLLVFADVTTEVRDQEGETRAEIETALSFMAHKSIDESQCSCLTLSRSNHCDTFGHFNSQIPSPSIYCLPRISKAKLEMFVGEGRFDLDSIGPDEVSPKQALVVEAAQTQAPVVDHAALAAFYCSAQFPIYFLDYETYSSAIPIVDGAQPQGAIPFQYSLHIKRNPNDAQMVHVEYLAEKAAMPHALIEHMQQHIGPVGSIVSWHASFENTQNKTMAAMYPDKADFLNGLIDRTLDLEDLFKDGYVDIRFDGSTSIKKVLPVLAPDLTYAGLDVANGTDAMEAWKRLIALPDGSEKDDLRTAMLEYCKLDTYAMVRIFDEMQRV